VHEVCNAGATLGCVSSLCMSMLVYSMCTAALAVCHNDNGHALAVIVRKSHKLF